MTGDESLGQCLLKRLPKTLVELDSLVEITVHNCRLTSPPQDIAARNIREIKAFFEKLVEAEFTNELLMDGYSLYDVPPDVPELEKLTSLNMSTNHISVLPAEIGELTALKIMKLDENKLTRLPDNIKDCISLETLCLSRFYEPPLSPVSVPS